MHFQVNKNRKCGQETWNTRNSKDDFSGWKEMIPMGNFGIYEGISSISSGI